MFEKIKKKIERSKVKGNLYILKHIWPDIKARAARAHLMQKATGRGQCVWCKEFIWQNDAAWEVCDGCRVFRGGSKEAKYLCGRCHVYEDACDMCPKRKKEYFHKERRVQ